MLFSSPIFLFWFFPLTLFAYYAMPRRSLKNILLAFASVFFYAWGEPVFVLLMLLSVFVSYVAGLLIEACHRSRRIQRLILVFVVLWYLSIFFVFKYWDFVFSNLTTLFPGLQVPLLHIGLPIGISFFTFQSMSYVFDVYRALQRGGGRVAQGRVAQGRVAQGRVAQGRVAQGRAAQRNFFNVLLYISLFPQLIAGPIVRYQDVAAQLTGRRENLHDFTSGIYRFLCGLSKKVLIANNMAIVADLAFQQSPSDLGTLFAWLGAISYTLQIYFDFSAYSDMAIGLGNVFGFHFLENFNYPYISKSLTEFWGRWHISLGSWFKDYVYIPMGGSRRGPWLTFRNLFVVWVLTGIWHGANWTFVIWGLYNFALVAAEKQWLRPKLRVAQTSLPFGGNATSRSESAAKAQTLSSQVASPLGSAASRSENAVKSSTGPSPSSECAVKSSTGPIHSAGLTLARLGLHVYVTLAFIVGWVIFRSDSLSYAAEYLRVMFTGQAGAIPGTFWFYAREYALFYALAILLSMPVVPWMERRLSSPLYYAVRNAAIAAFAYISVIYLIKGVYNPFIYFNF